MIGTRRYIGWYIFRLKDILTVVFNLIFLFEKVYKYYWCIFWPTLFKIPVEFLCVYKEKIEFFLLRTSFFWQINYQVKLALMSALTACFGTLSRPDQFFFFFFPNKYNYSHQYSLYISVLTFCFRFLLLSTHTHTIVRITELLQ